ncbi:MAG: hypothetical protein ACRDTT_20530 [Pseudonocardiaceae bacterium]
MPGEVAELGRLLDTDNWETIGTEQPDLHQDRGLVPVNVLVSNCVALEGDDHDVGTSTCFPVGATPGMM